jgi:MFS family permease
MITGFFVAFGMFGAIIYVPLIYQGVLGIAATNSGLLITPMMVGLVAASLLTGQIITRFDRYRFVGTVGILVMMAGLFLLSQVNVGTSQIEVVRDLILVGLGLGVTMPLYINATQAAVSPQFVGVVSSQIQFWRNVGGTVGVSILGAVLAHELPAKIQGQVASLNLPPEALAAIPTGSSPQIFDPVRLAALQAQLPPALQPIYDQVLVAIRAALALTLHDVFFYATAIVAVAVVASVFLVEVPIRGHTPRELTESENAPAYGA